MMLAQIVIDYPCPSWVPQWWCFISARTGLDAANPFSFLSFNAVFTACVVALIWYDITHPVGEQR